MISDEMKSRVVSYIKDTLIHDSKIGLGGNSTNPTSTDLDVPLSVTPTMTLSKSDLNVLEIKLSIAGNTIQGKVIRELGIFDDGQLDDSGNARSPTRDDLLLQRINFDGVGPFASNETLEIFVLMEIE